MQTRKTAALALGLVAALTATQSPLAAPSRSPATAPVDGWSNARGPVPGDPPNVVVILTDDQRPGTLRYMRATRRLFARGGTTFTNAFATTPLCCPARASIMTGRYVHNHGVHTNEDTAHLDQSTTVQSTLGGIGYQTGHAGKFLNSWPLREKPPYFDRWSTLYPKGPITKHYFKWGVHTYNNPLFDDDGRLRLIHRYSTDHIRARSIRFLDHFERDDARPWMLYVWPYAPHKPATPASRHRGTGVHPWQRNPAINEGDRTDKPLWVQQADVRLKPLIRLRRKQLLTLRAVDDLVERLFRRMRALGEARNTLAFFLSDNGYLWGDHGLGGKQYPYRASVRIPFMARWPAGPLVAGGKDDRLVANIDVVPTILDAIGIDSALSQLDGRSLLDPGSRDRLLLEYFQGDGGVPSWASTITHDYQYIEHYEENVVIFREYYDLIVDPWQLNNAYNDTDPTNDPLPTETVEMNARLTDDRDCQGTEECP